MSVPSALAEALGLGRGTALVLLGVAVLLLMGTVKRAIWILCPGADAEATRRWRSVLTWWGHYRKDTGRLPNEGVEQLRRTASNPGLPLKSDAMDIFSGHWRTFGS